MAAITPTAPIKIFGMGVFIVTYFVIGFTSTEGCGQKFSLTKLKESSKLWSAIRGFYYLNQRKAYSTRNFQLNIYIDTNGYYALQE